VTQPGPVRRLTGEPPHETYLAVGLDDGVLWAAAGVMVAPAAGSALLVRHRLIDRLLAEAEAAER